MSSLKPWPASQRLRVATPGPDLALRTPRVVALDVERPRGRRDHGLRGLDPRLLACSYPRLEWEPPTGDEPMSPPLAGCLWEFVDLDVAEPEAIAAFARRWGTLGICKHLRPCTHSLDCLPLGSQIGRTGRGRHWEPLECWGRWVAEAQAIVGVAAAIRQRLDVQPDDIETRGESRAFAHGTSPREYLRAMVRHGWSPREYLRHAVRRWFHLAYVTVRIEWQDSDVAGTVRCAPYRENDLRLAGTVFHYLAIQLAAAVSVDEGVYGCELCGTPFQPPGRRPRTDRAVYCSACRPLGRRASKRKWWLKNRARPVAVPASPDIDDD